MNQDKVLSERVKRMNESATLAMAQMARDVESEGHDVISLSLGQPDFDTPDHIKDAAKKALDDGYTKYTPVAGLLELRKAIIKKFKRDNDLHFELDQVTVANGAKQTIYNICHAVLDPGDEVIIFSPYWVSYSAIVDLAGGTIVPIGAGIENDFKVTADQLDNAITDKTKLVLFSSPCNPTGSVYSFEELEAIASVIAKHDDILIIADEIYEFINFTGKHVSIGSFDTVKDRTITVNGMSKGFAMTGWRIGYMGGPAWVVAACNKVQGQCTSGASAFGQMGAAYALAADLKPTHDMRAEFLKRKKIILELIKDIPGIKCNDPEGAFYIFPDVSSIFGKSDGQDTIRSADDFAIQLLRKGHVAIVSGSSFGDDNCIRISYASSEEDLREAFKRIDTFVRSYS